MLENQWAKSKFVCVGLDSELAKIPEFIRNYASPGRSVLEFNTGIVTATAAIAGMYKPNIASYEALGDEGLKALQGTISLIKERYPEIPIILDAKRADIGNTNIGYVQAAFDWLGADAITVHPYLGQEALQPFLDRREKGIIVLCRTSNKGAGEFQDLDIPRGIEGLNSHRLYEVVAENVAQKWNVNGNCALVVGATYPDELKTVRSIVGNMPILIPGIGAQGGDLEKTVQAGKDSRGRGMIINSSRGIIFASDKEDYDVAAQRETLKLHKAISACLEKGVVAV